MRGASGAQVLVHNYFAVKTAEFEPALGRLRAQHDWLTTHRTAPVVQVYGELINGYEMERLEEWRCTPPAARLIAPAEKLWELPAEVPHHKDRHMEWVLEKMSGAAASFGNEFISSVMLLARYVESRRAHLTKCLTHGDLTRVNMMYSSSRLGSVLIDPIPATLACADVWVFDVSKLFVSLLGYEHVAFGWPPSSDEDRLWVSNIMMRMNPVEVECVRYMGVVQIARMLPYHPRRQHDGLIDIARQALRLRP